MHPLSEPFVFRRTGLEVKNRCVLAAMTNKQSQEDGVLSQDEIAWLKARSSGGFGIVTTAAAHVHEDGKGWNGEMGVWSDEHLTGLTQLAQELRQDGSVGLVQLFHGGMRAPESLTGKQPVSASINALGAGLGESRAMEEQEILDTVQAFGKAAQRCETAGFHGVELHGAHGYLIAQFLRKRHQSPRRPLGGRWRPPTSVPERHCRGRSPTHIAHLLGGDSFVSRIDVHAVLNLRTPSKPWICVWNSTSISFMSPVGISQNRPLMAELNNLTRHGSAKRINGKLPLISTGGVWNAQEAKMLCEQGADLVGVARAGIAHPDWPTYLEDGENTPKRPPFSADELEKAALSPVFVEYMRRWDGFVVRKRPCRDSNAGSWLRRPG